MKNLFLICGDEELLKEQKRDELLKKYNCEGSLNYNVFRDENIDLYEIKGLIGTMPFMEDLRKIQISGSGFFKGSAAEEVLETFKDVPETTVVIFHEKDADRSNALYKYVGKNGEVFRFDSADSKSGKEKSIGRSDVRNWAKQVIRDAGRRMDSRTLFELVEMTGYDMQNLSTELEKLICYTLGKPQGYVISGEDVDAVCSKTLSDRIFDMIDLKLRGNTAAALEILEELYSMKTAAMRILYVIVRQYNQALAFKECREKRMSDAETAAELGIKDWLIDRMSKQLERVSSEELKARLEACAETEFKIKQGDLPEKLALELLIIR
ncbi:MAG: DNA polymerase III subunit delta [Eubacteriales bacterium]|nr:DNA polymerase III subunit delta [Eubacteriales bacterium]